MGKLRIYYSGQSPDHSHPADRRRIVYWAQSRGHVLVGKFDSPDLVVLTSRSNFSHWTNGKNKIPFVLDLIDGYLGKTPTSIDYARGFSKTLTNQISGKPRKFTQTIQSVCEKASVVICETVEQREQIQSFNPKVFPILDFHEEFPFVEKEIVLSEKPPIIFWEGLPYTASGINLCSQALYKMKKKYDAKFLMVTDSHYKKVLGAYISRPTLKLVKQIQLGLKSNLEFRNWSLEEVIASSRRSTVGILPINSKSHLSKYKAENRMLIMWRLGLPVLASPTLAYNRVMNEVGLLGICNDENEWTMKLENILNDEEELQRNVRLGQDYIKRFHSKEETLRKWDFAIESAFN
jgi:hypothetical protein